jgi:hypothetical protein
MNTSRRSTAHQEWLERDLGRRRPDVDFGTTWTRARDDETWRVSWNPATGDLYAVNRTETDIAQLGHYPTEHDVQAALTGWGHLAQQPGALDALRQQLVEHARSLDSTTPDQPSTTTPSGTTAVYGVMLHVDGTATTLNEPVTVTAVQQLIDPALDIARVRHPTLSPRDRVVMWVADNASAQHRPVNPIASQLYGTGWPICGPVIVVDDDSRPLPDVLVREITGSPDLDVDPGIDWHALEATTPLEIDDHLDARDRQDTRGYGGAELDEAVDIAERHHTADHELELDDDGWDLT